MSKEKKVTQRELSPHQNMQSKCHSSRPQGACTRLNVHASYVSILGACDVAKEAEASDLMIVLRCLRNINSAQMHVESDCVVVVSDVNSRVRNIAK